MSKTVHQISDVLALYGQTLFAALEEEASVPWANEQAADQLNLMYILNRSGDKWCSPLLEHFVPVSGDPIIDYYTLRSIAGVLAKMYLQKWEKEWATLELQYNPIENYSMTEQMLSDSDTTTYGRTTNRTGTNIVNHNSTDTETPDETITDEPDVTRTTQDDTYGFNSSEAVHAGLQTEDETGTTTRTRTGENVRTVDGQDYATSSEASSEGGSDRRSHTYQLKRSGNVGVTTSQQMALSERELWMWNFFEKVLFPDIDRVLTLAIY